MLYTLEELYNKKEDQTFDRKSARKDPKGLSNHVVAFANADGGTLVIGIEDDSTVTGIDDYQNNINDILRVPFDYCKPSIRITTETIDCVDKDGKPNHLLVISIPQSSELHANQQDDVYYRMGDKSKKLNFDSCTILFYVKVSEDKQSQMKLPRTPLPHRIKLLKIAGGFLSSLGPGKEPLQ
mgnify:FL=1